MTFVVHVFSFLGGQRPPNTGAVSGHFLDELEMTCPYRASQTIGALTPGRVNRNCFTEKSERRQKSRIHLNLIQGPIMDSIPNLVETNYLICRSYPSLCLRCACFLEAQVMCRFGFNKISCDIDIFYSLGNLFLGHM